MKWKMQEKINKLNLKNMQRHRKEGWICLKNSFVLYTEQKAIFDKLSDEQAGKLIKAIYEYVEKGKIDNIDEITNIIITPFITVLDKDMQKYEETKKKRAEAGAKGGKQKVANQANAKSAKQKVANQAVYDNEYVNEYDNDNIINDINNKKENIKEKALSETKVSTSDIAKANRTACKHKYGEYKHVLLKDEELQALKRDYSNWKELIIYLDEYIEMKGYKAKSHYLAIRKWVTEAVKRNKKQSKDKNYECGDDESL